MQKDSFGKIASSNIDIDLDQYGCTDKLACLVVVENGKQKDSILTPFLFELLLH